MLIKAGCREEPGSKQVLAHVQELYLTMAAAEQNRCSCEGFRALRNSRACMFLHYKMSSDLDKTMPSLVVPEIRENRGLCLAETGLILKRP